MNFVEKHFERHDGLNSPCLFTSTESTLHKGSTNPSPTSSLYCNFHSFCLELFWKCTQSLLLPWRQRCFRAHTCSASEPKGPLGECQNVVRATQNSYLFAAIPPHPVPLLPLVAVRLFQVTAGKVGWLTKGCLCFVSFFR